MSQRRSACKESVPREETGQSRMKFGRGGSVRSLAGSERPELENIFQDETSEHLPQDKENRTGRVEQSDKWEQTSEGVQLSRLGATRDTIRERTQNFEGPRAVEIFEVTEQVSIDQTPKPGYYEEVLDCPHRFVCEEAVEALSEWGPDLSNAAPSETATLHATCASQIAEQGKRYDALSRDYESVRGKLEAKRKLLEERDFKIGSLNADIVALRRSYEEQSTALASVRHRYRSCQSQLDNVQRFISTADRHADQDIIQKLQELNEEVYQMSMTMVDYVAEGYVRQSATARQRKISAGESISGTIGQVMVTHLAAVEGDEDIALFLHIAFQGYLAHLLRYIVSSWTADQKLNELIEATYQRLRKSETQAISGHWRSLARANILPTHASEPKFLVEHIMKTLLDIVIVAGLFSPRPDAVSKFSSKFGEKILTIVSHAGAFGTMVSEMISGDFEVFAIQSGATFDQKTMVDMNKSKDQVAPRGMGAAQTVLCMSRVGLRKQMGGKVITLTKAQVVLTSFLC
ncbi:hypothetical protein HD554DRAFT_1206006 [Boletus coccyginus]|nr:hypothetical protein HD554DRAFT_1206006 [Boletus coccyginus]